MPQRSLRWWLAGTLLGGVACLAAARYISSARWIDALAASGVLFGMAAAVALAAAARRLTRHWLAPTAAGLAVGAALTRATLIARLVGADEVAVDFWQVTLAGASVAWGALALLWGALGVGDCFNRGDSSYRNNTSRYIHLMTAAGGVTLALYSVAPLFALFGVNVNLWTLLGLFALAGGAYGAGCLYRWLTARLQGDDG